MTVGFYCREVGAIIQCDDRNDDFGEHGFRAIGIESDHAITPDDDPTMAIRCGGIGATLGGYREANRLKQKRDGFLERAAWHAEGAKYYRGMIASSDRSVLYKTMAAEVAVADELISAVQKESVFERTLELWFDLPDRKTSQAAAADLEKLRNEKARAAAMAVRKRRVIDEYIRSHVVHHQQLAEHHAALRESMRTSPRTPGSPSPPIRPGQSEI